MLGLQNDVYEGAEAQTLVTGEAETLAPARRFTPLLVGLSALGAVLAVVLAANELSG